MADSTAKQIVFIVTLLGMFFALVMAMPTGFYAVAPDYDETDYPEYWDIGDIQEVKYIDEKNMTYQVTQTDFAIVRAGDTLYVRCRWWWNTGESARAFHFWHWNWGFLGLGIGDIEPYPLLESEVLANVDESGNFSRFLMTCDHYNYIVYIGNNGTYTDLEDALNNDAVGVSIGVDYEYETSGLSGWGLVTRLLTFQLPNVTTELSFVIALPLYTLIGVLAFILFTMIVEMFPTT